MTKYEVSYRAAFEAASPQEAVDKFRAMVADDRDSNYFVVNHDTRFAWHYGPMKGEARGADAKKAG